MESNNKNIIVIVSLVVIIIIIVVIFIIIRAKHKNNEYFSNSINKEYFSNNTNKAFVGAWASNIECGQGLKYVALASALPQDWSDADPEKFFSTYISGNYSSTLSNGYTKYLLSIGGSNATPQGWINLLSGNLETTAKALVDGLRARGLVGIDFDLENVPVDSSQIDYNTKMSALVTALRNVAKYYKINIIIMYTIFLGSPSSFSTLVGGNQMDYVTLMLYDGGMYTANGTGAGCNWDQWAELFLSQCKTCNCRPLIEDCSTYCSQIKDLPPDLSNKIVLALITDTAGNKLTGPDLEKAMYLCYKYSAAGIFFWVLPGWVSKCTQKDICVNNLNIMRNYNPSINNYFELPPVNCPSICPTTMPGCCPNAQNGCQSCSGNCIATPCGKRMYEVTDNICAECLNVPGDNIWACANRLCQCSQASSQDDRKPCPKNPDPCP